MKNVRSKTTNVPFFGSLGSLILCCLFVGCGDEARIRVYRVAKDNQAESGTASQAAGKQQRMLGAILPAGETAWFIKLMDAPEKVGKRESDFRSLVDSLKFSNEGQPKYEPIEGWEVQPVRQIVFDRLTHAADGISATVTQLPASTESQDQWQQYVVENVNRWRGQLSLPPADWGSLQSDLEEVPSQSKGPAKAYLVSIEGKSSGGGMGAPFANAPFMQSTQTVEPTESKDEVPTEAASSSTVERKVPISYTVPESWTEVDPGSPFRLAGFQIESEGQTGSVSVSTASGENEMLVGMWLSQLKVEANEETITSVLESSEKIDVNSVESQVFVLTGSGEGDDNETVSILVAKIPWKDQESLFVKLTGDSELVAAQRDSFLQFVESMSW